MYKYKWIQIASRFDVSVLCFFFWRLLLSTFFTQISVLCTWIGKHAFVFKRYKFVWFLQVFFAKLLTNVLFIRVKVRTPPASFASQPWALWRPLPLWRLTDSTAWGLCLDWCRIAFTATSATQRNQAGLLWGRLNIQEWISRAGAPANLSQRGFCRPAVTSWVHVKSHYCTYLLCQTSPTPMLWQQRGIVYRFNYQMAGTSSRQESLPRVKYPPAGVRYANPLYSTLIYSNLGSFALLEAAVRAKGLLIKAAISSRLWNTNF